MHREIAKMSEQYGPVISIAMGKVINSHTTFFLNDNKFSKRIEKAVYFFYYSLDHVCEIVSLSFSCFLQGR